MTNLLEMEGVSRHVSGTFSLGDVSLTVGPGEVVGFVGANGAGKTTTLRAALGLMHVDSGSIKLFGRPFDACADGVHARAVCSRVGVVLDTCPFPRDRTVAQAAACVSPAYPAWDQARFEALATAFGLSLKARVADLSRGMGMKLQLAVALSHGAELLVLDEATAGLDPIARDEALDMLRDFASEPEDASGHAHGVLLSSHITTDLERIADRVVAIGAGRILFDVARDDITDRAGIARCIEAQADEVLGCVEGARKLRREFSFDVLVPNRFEFAEAFPDVPCDHASIDDYLHFFLEGETR